MNCSANMWMLLRWHIHIKDSGQLHKDSLVRTTGRVHHHIENACRHTKNLKKLLYIMQNCFFTVQQLAYQVFLLKFFSKYHKVALRTRGHADFSIQSVALFRQCLVAYKAGYIDSWLINGCRSQYGGAQHLFNGSRCTHKLTHNTAQSIRSQQLSFLPH